ncbi:MAG: endonuclease [Lentimicrobiaceae bacterium]|nr:endonuclease [Lentimicrobiaceae bacterium]
MKKIVLFLLVCCGFAIVCHADEPQGYYAPASNKSGLELKKALSNILRKHKQLEYAELWNAYQFTDADEDGNIFDMYNDCDFKFKEDQCGSGSSGDSTNQCVCYNREHAMPKSWFNNEYPMYTDLFHLYPVSGYVNSRRNNYPFGEVGEARFTSTSGSKLGKCNFPGYEGIVFEPIDEYKGDFARTYFYMATCYHNRIETWKSEMLAGNNIDDFTEWSKALLLKWHHQDPVSEKEILRNEAVYEIQGNRNPFIDYPELVEKIWGNDTTAWNNTPDDPDDPEGSDTTAVQHPFWNKCSVTIADRFLQIDYAEGLMESIEIFSATGIRICATFVRQNRFGYRLPSAGIYIVRISAGKRQFTRKVATL